MAMTMGMVVTLGIVTVGILTVGVVMGVSDAIGLAGPCALEFTEGAAFGQTLHVVMMTFLNASNVLLEAQHLSSVFAQ